MSYRSDSYAPRPFAFDPLLKASGMGLRELARAVEVDPTQLTRWRKIGLRDDQADRLACLLGLHPSMIWTDWYDFPGYEPGEPEGTQLALPLRWQRKRRGEIRRRLIGEVCPASGAQCFHVLPFGPQRTVCFGCGRSVAVNPARRTIRRHGRPLREMEAA